MKENFGSLEEQLQSLQDDGLVEIRVNPETGQEEYYISPKGLAQADQLDAIFRDFPEFFNDSDVKEETKRGPFTL